VNALELLLQRQASLNREACELERRMCAAYRKNPRARDWETDREKYIRLRDELAELHFDALEMSGRRISDIRESCIREWRDAARRWHPTDLIKHEPTAPQARIRYRYDNTGCHAVRECPQRPAAPPADAYDDDAPAAPAPTPAREYVQPVPRPRGIEPDFQPQPFDTLA